MIISFNHRMWKEIYLNFITMESTRVPNWLKCSLSPSLVVAQLSPPTKTFLLDSAKLPLPSLGVGRCGHLNIFIFLFSLNKARQLPEMNSLRGIFLEAMDGLKISERKPQASRKKMSCLKNSTCGLTWFSGEAANRNRLGKVGSNKKSNGSTGSGSGTSEGSASSPSDDEHGIKYFQSSAKISIF